MNKHKKIRQRHIVPGFLVRYSNSFDDPRIELCVSHTYRDKDGDRVNDFLVTVPATNERWVEPFTLYSSAHNYNDYQDMGTLTILFDPSGDLT